MELRVELRVELLLVLRVDAKGLKYAFIIGCLAKQMLKECSAMQKMETYSSDNRPRTLCHRQPTLRTVCVSLRIMSSKPANIIVTNKLYEIDL